MEVLESVVPRPRQARYQAGLRPDRVSLSSKVLSYSTPSSRLISVLALSLSYANLPALRWGPA